MSFERLWEFLVALAPFAMMFSALYIGEQTTALALRLTTKIIRAERGQSISRYAIFAAFIVGAGTLIACGRLNPSLSRGYPIPVLCLFTFFIGGLIASAGACVKAWRERRTATG